MIAPYLLSATVLLLILAAVWDVTTMTIPNWISALAAALFPIAALTVSAPPAIIAFHIGFGAAVLLGCFFLFLAGVLGGGDAKLIPAAAVWIGAPDFATFAVIMALAGGALAVTILAARRFATPSDSHPAFVNRLLNRKGGIPYGVAIAAAFIWVYAHTEMGEFFANAAARTELASTVAPFL